VPEEEMSDLQDILSVFGEHALTMGGDSEGGLEVEDDRVLPTVQEEEELEPIATPPPPKRRRWFLPSLFSTCTSSL
jgi:hypothetical protein